ISTLYGHDHVDTFVGIGSGLLYSVDPSEDGVIEPLVWTNDDNLSPVSYAFAEDGELFVILDNQGGLTLLDTHDWDVLGERLQVTGSTSALEGSPYTLTISGEGHFAFVGDSSEQEIKVVDLEDLEVVETFTVDFVPHRLVWLGV